MTNITYSENGKFAEFNGKRYARDDRTGYYLFHGEGGVGSRLHRDVWTFYNCEIPKGHEVHHKDHNKGNNDISNLQLLKKGEHSKLHRAEMTEEEREFRRQNLIDNARPAASKWHKSDAGRKWHSEMSKKSWEDKKPITYICDNCGKEFETTNTYSKNGNKFCTNACKSAYRRKLGVDNVERVCEYCGKTYVVGKYIKRKFCGRECAYNARWGEKK